MTKKVSRNSPDIDLQIYQSPNNVFALRGTALTNNCQLRITIRDLNGETLESFDEFQLSQGQQFTRTSTAIYQNDSVVEVCNAKNEVLLYANRHIKLDGATNFRDFGGYFTKTNGQLPWRRYFRSDNLSTFSSSDYETIENLRIKTIFDLRRRDEGKINRTILPSTSSIEIIEVPITSTLLGYEEAIDAIFDRQIARIRDEDMAEMYTEIVTTQLDEVIAVARQMIESSADATLVHCTAGKDRTGITAALVQLALGVSEEDVRNDYLLSNRYRTPVRMLALEPRFTALGLEIANFKPYFSAPYHALDTVLETLIDTSKLLFKN